MAAPFISTEYDIMEEDYMHNNWKNFKYYDQNMF